jgi:general secretion pathway protein G
VYNNDNNRYPQSLSQVGYGTYLDPWGSPYQYLDIQEAEKKGNKDKPRKDRWVHPINTDYDLYSMGADGASVPPLTAQQSRDDVVRANNGAYIGLASEF